MHIGANLQPVYNSGSATHHGCTMDQLRKTIEEVRALGPILCEIHAHPITINRLLESIEPAPLNGEMGFWIRFLGVRVIEDNALPPWPVDSANLPHHCIRKVYSNT